MRYVGKRDGIPPEIFFKSTIKEESIMNEQIKRAIRQKARSAKTKNDLVRAVFETFKNSQVDVHKVSLEDMKIAVVEAARAARQAQGGAEFLLA
jgi:anti-sigma regulatory factor (Ser/Thr protein kinase)